MPPKRKSLTKRLNRLERDAKPEVKHHSGYSGAFDTVGSISGTLIRTCSIAQGTGRSYRVGDAIKAKNCRFKAIVKMPSLASNPTCAIRLLVLRARDRQDIDASNMPNWYSQVDEEKFIVIKDVLTQVSQLGTRNAGGNGDSFSTGSTLKQFNYNLKLGNRKLVYDGGLTTPMAGETFIYMLAENQSAEVAYNWRMYYTDP